MSITIRSAATRALPVDEQHAPWYPEEPKSPHARCWSCGWFLRWDDYYGRYRAHVMWDDYMGAWELTCYS